MVAATLVLVCGLATGPVNAPTLKEFVSSCVDEPERIFARFAALSIPLDAPLKRHEFYPKNAESPDKVFIELMATQLLLDLNAAEIMMYEGKNPGGEAWGKIAFESTEKYKPRHDVDESPTNEDRDDQGTVQEMLQELRWRRTQPTEKKHWDECDQIQHKISRTEAQARIQSLLQRLGSDAPVSTRNIDLVRHRGFHWLYNTTTTKRDGTPGRFVICSIPCSDLESARYGYSVVMYQQKIDAIDTAPSTISAAKARAIVSERLRGSEARSVSDKPVRAVFFPPGEDSFRAIEFQVVPAWLVPVDYNLPCETPLAELPTTPFIVERSTGEVIYRFE